MRSASFDARQLLIVDCLPNLIVTLALCYPLTPLKIGVRALLLFALRRFHPNPGNLVRCRGCLSRTPRQRVTRSLRTTHPGPSRETSPALDGVRALAILGVMCLSPWPRMGLGGDISGWTFRSCCRGLLITSLLLEDGATSGRISPRGLLGTAGPAVFSRPVSRARGGVCSTP